MNKNVLFTFQNMYFLVVSILLLLPECFSPSICTFTSVQNVATFATSGEQWLAKAVR